MDKIKSLFQKPAIAIGISGASLLVACIACASLWFYALGAPATIEEHVAETLAAVTPVPTHTDRPTYTPPPTLFVTKLVIVTPTFTATPLYTPTVTHTPAPPTSTPNAAQTSTALSWQYMTNKKPDGFYLVGIDIAPGVWRSTGTSTNCYWSVTSKTGDILDNHFGMAGGTAYVSPSAFQVEFSGCGIWVYVSPP